MHTAIEEHHGSDVVSEILSELADYTKIHFAVEESLMRILDYPGYEDHKEIHDELLNNVLELQKKVAFGKTAISFELMHFLKSWLSKHILEEDMQYSGFFIASGAKPELKSKSWIKRLWGS
ncbi:MAG: bacteriohemerythrin [gamma proteobacterium symbiont of Lucinoma myriamae]|nr:bacteriohemerythrin [gamma proteobacterium symbiont of Lucinoma myriamae]MCU7833340.1 bacteriohemerythrin [gamma proteobacterium symbiont of Lucinoma myriamae]